MPTTIGIEHSSPAENRCCAVDAFIFAARLKALANQQRQILEHLHHVRAGLPLQDQAGDEELQIDQRYALAEVAQSDLRSASPAPAPRPLS